MEHGKKSDRIVRPLTAPAIRTSSRQNGPPSIKSSHQTTRVRPATAKASIQLPPRSPSPGHSQYIESLFQTSDRLILGRSVKTNRGEKGWIGCLRTPQYHSSIGHSQKESSRQEQLTSETTRPDNSDSDDEAGATPYDTKKVIDETNEKLKRNLHQRLTAHKNIGITSDVIFQMQLRSSFWTSDMLYHNWGSHLLDLRERNCQSSGNIGNISKESTEEEPLPQTNERRAAICFHMAHNTPLSIGTLGSLSSANHREVIIDRKTRRSSNILPEKSGEPEVEDPISRRIRLRETLKRAIRIIKIVSLIASCMLRSSKDSTTETFVAQLHYITSRPENLPFNKKRFLKDNSLRVPSWLPQIADTLPKDRTPEAIYKLYGVMNDMKSFERFTPKVRLELCRVARYMSCGKGRVIVRQGHVGFGFYFIYSGSVFVQLDIADQTGVVTSQTVNIIGKGACFGELALLGDGRRTASIICRETTELFEIEKDTFLESCPYIYEDELNEKIDIASKFEFFRKWPKSSLHRLCFESQIQEVPYGRIVDRDTVATDYLYFVLKGKLVMLKELDLTRFIKSNNQLSLKIYAGKQLPTPRPHTSSIGGSKTFPHATKHNKCYIKIGDIQDGQSTEMTSLKQTDDGKHKPTGVILVSNGVRLMCMSKRKLQAYAPKQLLDDFTKTYEPEFSVPNDEELYMKYLADINWQTFKSNVIDTLYEEKKGEAIIYRPATSKGSTGWSRWPGSRSQAKSNTRIRSKSESHLQSNRYQGQPRMTSVSSVSVKSTAASKRSNISSTS